MQRILSAIIACCVLGALLPAAHGQASARKLVPVAAPAHDPLFVDAATVQRKGRLVSFKYSLDVLAPPDESSATRAWKSNEIEAAIDCGKRTVSVRRLVAYSGPGASGNATAVHAFTSPGIDPVPIAPKSTFAYLERHLCRDG